MLTLKTASVNTLSTDGVQWARGRGLDWQCCFPFLQPYPAQEGRLWQLGSTFSLKDTDLDGYKCRGNLEELGCGMNMIKTYMKFSKNKLKKKANKFFLSVFDPSSPKGSKHFSSIFYCGAHWTLEIQTVAQEGRTVRALLCPPLYCAVNLRVHGTSALQRF